MITFPGFLSAEELDLLCHTCASKLYSGYRTDRGYFYIPVSPIPAVLAPLHRRAAMALGMPPNDCFFLVYSNAEAAAPHVDSGRVRRLIALLEDADGGSGELVIGGRPASLAVGDAVVFSPEAEVHEVTAVTGRRVVWSVGVRR